MENNTVIEMSRNIIMAILINMEVQNVR